MTDREQLISMLQRAGIEFREAGGKDKYVTGESIKVTEEDTGIGYTYFCTWFEFKDGSLVSIGAYE